LWFGVCDVAVDLIHKHNHLVNDEGRYRLLVENITDYAIYMVDTNGLVASWNQGAERFKGYTASEIIGQHFSCFYTEEDRNTDLPSRALAMARTEGKFEQEGWRVRKDGSRFWAIFVIDPIRDADKDIVGYAIVTRDLTQRKLATETLRASEEQFRLLVQSVTDYAIYMLDTNGVITNWNSGAERIKGYNREEIVGQHFSQFYTPEDRATGLPARALEIARTTGRFARDGWRLRKDGRRFWASVVIDPVLDDDGKLVGFAKVTRDITERLEAEQTLEKTREALFQSQKMEAIGHLTGGVAHDFNNLLSAALGSLELMERRLPEGDARLHVLHQNAVAALKRGSSLTQRMLAFARRQDLKSDAIDVRALVDGLSDLIQRSLGPSVILENRVPGSLPRIRADANQVEMALLNLTMNARDAMPDGGAIVLDAHLEHQPEEMVCLSVTDQGIGMDEETLKKAVEPFYTTKGVGRGTGLGLSMVKGLAEQSGGFFKLNSKKGQGTRAEIYLPVAPSATEEIVKSSEQEGAPGTKMRVLAVDDDPLVLLNTLAMLEELGHEPVEATSGAKALDILAQDAKIDLVVTDQAMPHMTGTQLVETLREKWPQLRVVIATGYAELPADSRASFFKLAKPFGQNDLARAIKDAPIVGVDKSIQRSQGPGFE
jgi:PAS domain S-box-containing protein